MRIPNETLDAPSALHGRLLKILEDAGLGFAGMAEARSESAHDLMPADAAGDGVAIVPASLRSVSEGYSCVTHAPPSRRPRSRSSCDGLRLEGE